MRTPKKEKMKDKGCLIMKAMIMDNFTGWYVRYVRSSKVERIETIIKKIVCSVTNNIFEACIKHGSAGKVI